MSRDGYSVLSKETVALIMCIPSILVWSWVLSFLVYNHSSVLADHYICFIVAP